VHFSSALLSNMNLCITNLQHTLMHSFVNLPALRVPSPQNCNSIAPPSILSRDHISGQSIRYVTNSLSRIVQIFGKNPLRHKNSIHEEIKCRLKRGYPRNHSLQSIVFQFHLQKYIKIYLTTILPVVLCGRETWFYNTQDDFVRNRMLRKIWA